MSEHPQSQELTPDQVLRLERRKYEQRDIMFWTVYGDPTDFPGKFVCRPSSIKHGTFNHHLIADSLDALRKKIPAGLIQMGRSKSDDPTIVEIWF